MAHTLDEMLRQDYTYVMRWSIRKDLKVMLRTIPVVFGRHHENL